MLRSQGNSHCHIVAFSSFHSTPNGFLFIFTIHFRMSSFPTRGSPLGAPLPFIPSFFYLCRHGCGTLGSTPPPPAASRRLRFAFSFFLSFHLFCAAPITNAICISKQEGARSGAARRETRLMHTRQQRGVYRERRWQGVQGSDPLPQPRSRRLPTCYVTKTLSRSFFR